MKADSSLAHPGSTTQERRAVAFARMFLLLALLLAILADGVALAAEQPRDQIVFVTRSGAHAFDVEIADTSQSRSVGLMNRREMADRHGMLFNFHVEEEILMWMKNTYIPLDMIFLSRKGRVISIAKHTQPLSEAVISSHKPAYAVLELNAGAADRIGLAVGDTAQNPIFTP